MQVTSPHSPGADERKRGTRSSSAATPRRNARRRGLTLVEVMMASFIMLLAISGSIVTLQYGFRALDTARKTTLAAQIMQSEMERIRMLSWSRVQALPEKDTVSLAEIFPQNTAEEIAVFNSISNTFQTVRTVENLADHYNEIREIRITITWRGIDGLPHTRTSSTQYSKDGLYAYYYRVP